MTRRTRGLLGTIGIIVLTDRLSTGDRGPAGRTLARLPGWVSILAFCGARGAVVRADGDPHPLDEPAGLAPHPS